MSLWMCCLSFGIDTAYGYNPQAFTNLSFLRLYQTQGPSHLHLSPALNPSLFKPLIPAPWPPALPSSGLGPRNLKGLPGAPAITVSACPSQAGLVARCSHLGVFLSQTQLWWPCVCWKLKTPVACLHKVTVFFFSLPFKFST